MSVFIDKRHLIHAFTGEGLKPMEFENAGDTANVPFTLGDYRFNIAIELVETPGRRENCAVCGGWFWSTGKTVCKECAAKGAK